MTERSKLVVKNLCDENYVVDKAHKELFQNLEKIKEQQRKDDFQYWLNNKTQTGFIVKNILNRMIQEIIQVLKVDGYLIKDEKAFRDYLASYIYREC